MAPRYDEAPETVPPAIPEYHPPPTAPEVTINHGYVPQQPSPPVFKREDSIMYNNYPGYAMSPMGLPSTQNYDTTGYGSLPSDLGARRKKEHTILGCSVVVFVLAVIIAILSAAVIGLAAGTGVEANRANTAESDLAALRANMTNSSSSSSGAAGGSYDAITGAARQIRLGFQGRLILLNSSTCHHTRLRATRKHQWARCKGSSSPTSTTASTRAPAIPSTRRRNFANTTSNRNKTCSGVTFVPGWTDRETALDGSAPGNCYLKPGPQSKSKLTIPNNGQETHSAFRLDD
ncbi:hypothetical protein PG994_012959 [Apiospora phragmitis]|uniref:Uncharacterized protein n=1 Tax=Apiospora phragmitis TaxID=2905665 RepID=A0ABR1T7A1_9PEZI